ncbi:hypothetical protein GWN42_07035, partial [candidate division KSB1 bacterium]|nr:hypothetical protein [candidate division KSB1 bacterium]
MKKANLFMALGLTLAMGTALAGNKIDRECSPGFYHNKNGLAYWWAACQSAGSVTVEGVTLT